MTENTQSNSSKTLQEQQNAEKKPNELVGVFYSEFIKISDPNTDEVLLQRRD
jgi:hypothetical protein